MARFLAVRLALIFATLVVVSLIISSATEFLPGDAAPTLIRLPGAVPTMREAFQGCFFAGRCPRKVGPICDDTPPPARTGPDSPDHVLYCHIPVDELAAMQREGQAVDSR